MQTNPDKRVSGNFGSVDNEDEMNEEDPTQGIPDRLQPFTENLEDLETHVPANPSDGEISDSEGDASIVVIQKRKHSIYTHFPKHRNCEICLRTKIMRVPCKRRNEGSIPWAEEFGDLITADHKVLNEGSEFRNNHRYAVVVQDLATQWMQFFRVKTKILRIRTRIYGSFSSRLKSRKSVTLTIRGDLANLVKSYHEIIEHPLLIDQKQTELQNEPYDE